MNQITQILKQYKEEYQEIIFQKESNNGKIFSAYNAINQRNCILKVISKEKLKLGDYTFLINQKKREEELTAICNSEYTVNLFKKLETTDYIIFELEYFEDSIYDYFLENGPLKRDLNFYKYIIHQLANALRILHQKGIMHRDIKPQNIFFKTENGEKIIKLGDFSCSILIKDNTSDPIGTFLYSSPEIISGAEYNEKSDLWSLGTALIFNKIYFLIN